MLETVRSYAAERLAQSGEGDAAMRERFAAHYVELAEELTAAVRTPREGAALAVLGQELENLRTAADWAQESGKRLLFARLTHSLYEVLYRLGFWKEAQERVTAAVAAISPETGNRALSLQAELRHALASIAHDRGDKVTAIRESETALKMRRELADPAAIARSLNLYALIGAEFIDGFDASTCLDEALPLVPFDDHAWLGVLHHNQGFLACEAKRWDESLAHYQEALSHRRAAGDLRGEAETLRNLGVLEKEMGKNPEAFRHYLEGLRMAEVIGDQAGIAVLLFNLGEIAEESGEMKVALALNRHAESIFADLGSPLVSYPRETLVRLRAAAEGGEQEPLPTWREVISGWSGSVAGLALNPLT
jgi:tetratricopeptide (TPR) repeat protein